MRSTRNNGHARPIRLVGRITVCSRCHHDTHGVASSADSIHRLAASARHIVANCLHGAGWGRFGPHHGRRRQLHGSRRDRMERGGLAQR
jgi:hypothetical protein